VYLIQEAGSCSLEAMMPRLGDRAPVTCPDTPLMLIGRAPGEDGEYGRTAPDAPLPRDPNDPSLWLAGQGQANACGTVTLAYILRYLLGSGAPTRDQIDGQLRRGNIFSAPPLLVACARQLGLAARSYNGASLDFVFGLVDRGVPVMVLTDTTPLNLRDTANLHWVALVAHCEDRVGIYNPHGFQEELDLASFQSHWRQARIFGLPAWSNFAIALGPDPEALPPAHRSGLSLFGADLASVGVAGVVNRALRLRARDDVTAPRAVHIADNAAGVVVNAVATGFGSALLAIGGAASGLGGMLRRRSG
jgi:hypothetical protein